MITEDESLSLRKLSAAQREAARRIEGPVLVLAGAGSGKTRTLTARIAYLIERGIPAHSLLAVTFTNKAAKEMKDRVARTLADSLANYQDPRWAQPWMGFSSVLPEVSTFHSFCLKILRLETAAAGLAPNFSIYDDGDQLALLKKIVDILGLSGRLGNAKAYQSAVNHAKTQAWTAEDLAVRMASGPLQEKVLEVYSLYQNALAENHAIDFGDIIVESYFLLRDHPQILEKYQERFRYLMVDEYQDTNRAQYLLLSLLAKKYRNLCVVGDEDQSIYKWRGADIRNILDFQKEYPEAHVVKLEENYRSTKTIIAAAKHVICNNQDRYDKTLFTENPEGEPIHVVGLENEREESSFVARGIQGIVAKNSRWNFNDVAIFYRSHVQSRALEEALRRERVPYRIIGGVAFYERKEIKDVTAYLRLLVNPHDSLSFERVINVPARGIGKTTVEKLAEYAQLENISLYTALANSVQGKTAVLGAAANKKLRGFYDFIEDLRQSSTQGSLSDLYQKVVQDSGYLLELQSENSEESRARIENLNEFYTVIQNFVEEHERGSEEKALLGNFLNQITLDSQVVENAGTKANGTVSLMTLHSSKGLEFPVVYLVGCEEGIFPSQRSVEEAERSEGAIEEERRLCYVGITRAMQLLTMTHVFARRIYGRVQISASSRFLEEIPAKYKRVEAKATAHGSVWESKARMQAKSGLHYDYKEAQSPIEIEATYGDTGEALEIGRKVFHAIYGRGTVRSIEGASKDRKVTIEFASYQKKKFLLRHVKLELL